jgi:hypothetical protein
MTGVIGRPCDFSFFTFMHQYQDLNQGAGDPSNYGSGSK